MIRTNLAWAAVGLTAATMLAGPATSRENVVQQNGTVRVDAPTTHVVTQERSGATRVHVDAPRTRVAVDTARGSVKIRVPGFSGDIRW